MKKAKIIALTLALTMILTTSGAFACTGMYIGKDVSAEGTTVVATSKEKKWMCGREIYSGQTFFFFSLSTQN